MPDDSDAAPPEDSLGLEGDGDGDGDGGQPTIDSARFRQVLGHFATGVTVITSMDRGEPVGLAVNSFTSVSLDPPLVAFCAAHGSTTWPRIRRSRRYCVNILGENQEDVSRMFAATGGEKFRGLGWVPNASGSPVLRGALAWIDCTIDAEHEAGDHVIVVGRVHELGLAEGPPLLFYRGGYARLQA